MENVSTKTNILLDIFDLVFEEQRGLCGGWRSVKDFSEIRHLTF